jgi:hypothetical protein
MTPLQKCILLALDLLYLPYIWGGNDPAVGLDCSGFAGWFLKQAGLIPADLDDTAQGYYNRYKGSPSEAAPGALVFYGKGPKQVTHVMVCVSPRGCIGAVGGNSATVSVEIAKQQKARVDIRPINYRSDLVAIVQPFN